MKRAREPRVQTLALYHETLYSMHIKSVDHTHSERQAGSGIAWTMGVRRRGKLSRRVHFTARFEY